MANILPTDLSTLTNDEMIRIVEDLRLHQAELEAQNVEMQHVQDHLENARHEYMTLYDESPVGYATLNNNYIILKSNQRLQEMLGIGFADISGKQLINYIHEEDQDVLRARFSAFFKRPDGKTLSVRMFNADGKIIHIRLEGRLTTDTHHELTLHTTFTDVTELKHAEEDIKHQVHHDELTGLYNRKYFEKTFSISYGHAIRQDLIGGLLFLDIDLFKSINDTYGHKVGDFMLIEVAKRLNCITRQEDTIVRLGGDEFVILIKEEKGTQDFIAAKLLQVAEKIRNELKKAYCINHININSSASIGIALFPKEEVSADTVLSHADTAMYEAKRSGRSEIKFFASDMQKKITDKLLLEKNIEEALEKENFILHYQAIKDSQSNIVSAEALIRWKHPLRGVLPPGLFINVAEESKLIVLITDWVINEGCRFLSKLKEQNLLKEDFHLSINISPAMFAYGHLTKKITQALNHHKIDAKHLRLEITEGLFLSADDSVLVCINELRNIGITFSIDDFGTGYSSLAYLDTLPINELKIDQSFIKGISPVKRDNAIIDTILLLANKLKLECVAEGIEEPHQYQYLKAQKCSRFQGYLFCYPLGENEFIKLLTKSVNRK